MANLINLERVSKSYGVRPLLDDVSLGISVGERVGVVGRNGDGKTTLLEVMTGIEQPDAGRVSRTRGVEIGYLHQGDELVDSHSVREAVLGGRRGPRVGRRRDDPAGGRGAARRRHPRPGGRRAVRRRAPSLRPGRAAALAPRPDRPRRADQPPRRRGRRVARRPPRQPAQRADRGDPRPVVPRRGLPDDVGGPRRRGRLLRGRVRGVRPREGGALAPGRRLGDASDEPRPQGARLAAARPAGAYVEAEVPHRRGQRPHRRRTRRRATGWSSSASPASGSARTSSTSRTSTSRAATRCCSTTPPGGSARATASASSGSTAPARPRCCR